MSSRALATLPHRRAYSPPAHVSSFLTQHRSAKNAAGSYESGPGAGACACGGGCPPCQAKATQAKTASAATAAGAAGGNLVLEAHQLLEEIKNAGLSTGGAAATATEAAGQNDPVADPGGAAPVAAPAAPSPDKELISGLLSGDADLKDVLNKRKLLRQGSTGEAVRRVQEALLAEGYELPRFGADGIYGPETAGAVREFQTRWRMDVDGIVGDQTLGLLDMHLAAKALLLAGEQAPILGGLIKTIATTALDVAEADKRKTACPAADQAERLTACVQPVAIADDAGVGPTVIPSLISAQRIWEKCCINLSVLPTQIVKKTDFQILDESPTAVPTVEETALFTAAGSSSCIQVFVPQIFQQGARIAKDISGGGAAYDAGTANPKVVVVEGAVPEVVAHEIGHAMGHLAHDAADTIMKPSGKHNAASSRRVSATVCTAARSGSVLSKTSGKPDCCMFPR
jgi:peptidoglycan hydrolase-like protein with peptidoglycan-binding domain